MDNKPLINWTKKAIQGLSPTQRVGHRAWAAIAAISITSSLFLGTLTESDPAQAYANPTPVAAAQTAASITLPLNLPDEIPANPIEFSETDPALPLDDAFRYQTVTVKPGDTLGGIFERIGLAPAQLDEIVNINEATKSLTRIHPGETFKIMIDDSGKLKALVYNTDTTHTLKVQLDEGRYRADLHERPVELRVSQGSGVITSSLFGAGQEAGMSDNVILKLAKIFGYDIDFALDIREGDRFMVLYEERYVEGAKIGDGEILAAEFTNRGKTYQALRFTTETGTDYYTPDGKTLRKAFLRTPVEFSRISSGFNLARRHPILNKIRAHKGVDYAAPTGTPIQATSNGRVAFAGTKGGYGKTVILKHGKQYSTLYGHLSRFSKSMRAGATVKQGDIIGYVGSTGLATGPHLHYEFHVNGAHRNPLSIKFIEAEPIPQRQLAEFYSKTRPLMAQINLLRRMLVAYNTH